MKDKTIHDKIIELVEREYENHKVCVNSIEIDWRNVSSLGEKNFLVTNVTINSNK